MLHRGTVALALVALAGGCQQAGGAHLDQYNVELREKLNTCHELDPQVSNEVIFVEVLGSEGVLHLGGELSFPVLVEPDGLHTDFVETDHTNVDGHHVVCKRLTKLELSIQDGAINGTYERLRAAAVDAAARVRASSTDGEAS